MRLTPVACSFEISPTNGRIQLFPFGRFYPADNRSDGVGGWYVNDSNGHQLAKQINQSQVRLMIDYEHQTIFIKDNGRGNPAAGWIISAEYISGEGLFADVEWTEQASNQIKSRQYRYISPLFVAAADGAVTQVFNAALTNSPALHELAEAYAASHTFFNQQKEKTMLELLRTLFGLPQATEAEITEKLTTLSESQADSAIALSEVYDVLKANNEKLVALSAQVQTGANQPDPTKFVALSEMKAVQDQLTALQNSVNADKVDALIRIALSDGRLLPAQKNWAENLGKNSLTALSDYLAVAVPNAALNGTQSSRQNPNEGKLVALSAAEKIAVKALGMTEGDYLAQNQTTDKE